MAVRVARENIAQNCLTDRVKVNRGNLLDDLDEPADLIVANIIAAVIIRLLPSARARLAPGGILIGGGISSPGKPGVLKALDAAGLKLIDSLEDKGWFTLAAVQK